MIKNIWCLTKWFYIKPTFLQSVNIRFLCAESRILRTSLAAPRWRWCRAIISKLGVSTGISNTVVNIFVHKAISVFWIFLLGQIRKRSDQTTRFFSGKGQAWGQGKLALQLLWEPTLVLTTNWGSLVSYRIKKLQNMSTEETWGQDEMIPLYHGWGSKAQERGAAHLRLS